MDMNPAWHQEFVDRLIEISEGPYQRLPALVDIVCAQIRDAHGAQPEASLTAFDKDCEAVRTRIAQRTEFLRDVLGR
jgi:hypothetical protein